MVKGHFRVARSVRSRNTTSSFTTKTRVTKKVSRSGKSQHSINSSHSVNSSNSPEVKGFVSGIEPDLVGVNKLIKKIQKMTVPAERSKIGFEEARKAYSAKNIDKFIREGRIPVPYTVRGEPMWGCYQQSMVLYYSMKALGFKPRICREVILPNIVHTRIWFRKNGQIYEADPYYQGTVRKINADRKKNVKEQMKRKKFAFIQPGEYTFKDYKEERRRNKIKKFF